ncbi:MAG: acyl-CoA carboxylase subunit beta [Deltaproteobacteria bacterium]|nr:acyl-CoA carboxylase subunit beta [Deltaproteobacteria bacterium]
MPSLKQLTEALLQKKQTALQMGGDEEIAKQRAQGKLTVRERINLLFDEETFTEIGILAEHQSDDPTLSEKLTPADGVVCGFGNINGRRAGVIAYDFTVIAGTIGEVNERKADRMREMALAQRFPLVWLLDSAGARIQEIASSKFASTGKLFYDQVRLSGVVPQVAAMMGPCAAGTAYIAGLADFVPMVKGTSSMALAGPPLVKAAIGEEITAENLGGSKVHCNLSGVGDLEVADDAECIRVVKKYLSYFPSHNGESAPVSTAQHSLSASDRLARALSGEKPDIHRLDDSILDILPESSLKIYDMKKVIEKITDDSDCLEIKPAFGRGLITLLARIGGNPVGIVASQPAYMGGVINIDESDKAARFINLCDAFNIPLVYLQDVPGFMVGSEVEKKGIIRHGAKMLFATSRATVPKITVIIRKAYGAGYYVMCGKAFGADLVVAWPTAEISLMGAEGAVNIIFRKEIQKSADPEKRRKELIAEYRQKIALDMAAGGAYIDDVIDPRDTKKAIVEALKMTADKKLENPEKKHGVMPV